MLMYAVDTLIQRNFAISKMEPVSNSLETKLILLSLLTANSSHVIKYRLGNAKMCFGLLHNNVI